MNFDNHPDLRLVNDQDDRRGSPSNAPRSAAQRARLGGDRRDRPDAPETLEQVRTRAVGGTFSQALIDEGFASALGVARTLAEQYHLPLVDLAVAGVDPEAAEAIALPVLERVCAIPFASDGASSSWRSPTRRTCAASTSSGSRRASRSSSTSLPKNDVLTELRRLSRAAEALNAAFVADAQPRPTRSDEDDLEADDGISRRAARSARQLDHLPGGRGGRERHPRRAAGARADRPLPDRRRPPRRPADPEAARRRRHDPPEGAREARHRRAAQAAGRPDLADRARRPVACSTSASRHSRPSRARPSTMRLLDKSIRGADARARSASPTRWARRSPTSSHRPTGALLVTGPTGSGKSTTLYAALSAIEPSRDQHHHRRGSGRVPARRDQPGADQPARRPHLRHRAAVDPPLRPRRRHGRRDPRRRDRADLDRGGAHRALRALDAAHERRSVGDHPAERDGRRAVHHRRGRLGRPRAASRAEALHPLRGALHVHVA